ncbi:hypothetical protein DITRI_Ditri03aG0100100 [Diplodiscus trichospermus]
MKSFQKHSKRSYRPSLEEQVGTPLTIFSSTKAVGTTQISSRESCQLNNDSRLNLLISSYVVPPKLAQPG